MYKASKEQQLTFDGFNQSCGMKLNPKDEYVILADIIDWAAVEAEYSALFKSRRRASPTRSTTSASRSQSSWRTCSESSSLVFKRNSVTQLPLDLASLQDKWQSETTGTTETTGTSLWGEGGGKARFGGLIATGFGHSPR